MLQVTGVRKRFGAVEALAGVDLDVYASEVVAIVGDNGAGKSTLIKAIAGVAPADDGDIRFDGEPVTIARPHDAQKLGIATVYQDLALCDNLDVVHNVFLGAEQHRAGVVDHRGMEHRTLELIRSLSVRIPNVRTPVAALSGGQRQSVAITRALLGDPRIVILDEPTAALGVEQTALVLRLIADLRDRGLGVVLISHNLVDVLAVADRVVVLRLGRNAGEFRAGDDQREAIVAAITGVHAGADPMTSRD